MHILNCDVETYSSVDLKKSGMYAYTQSPDFEVLMFAYSYDGGMVNCIDIAQGEKIPPDIIRHFFEGDTQIHAFNAAFEWCCLSKYFGQTLDIRRFRCTMFKSLYCGFTTALGTAAVAIGLPIEKQKMGMGVALIRTFCVPVKPVASNNMRTRNRPMHDMAKWNLFKDYCKQDVITEMALAKKLENFHIPPVEQFWWEIDQMINFGGIRVDRELIENALAISDESTNALMEEAIGITKLVNPKSVKQLSAWLSVELDEEIEGLTKDAVKKMLGEATPDSAVERVLQIRLELAKTSVKKYQAMANCLCADGRVRGLVQYYGANRTGRWAGRLVQIQNLPKNYISTLGLARELVKNRKGNMLGLVYGNVPDTLSQLIRTAFIPSEGKRLIVCDFSAIEARVLAWLAGEQWVMDVFAGDGKIYEATASQMFHVHIETIIKGHEDYKYRNYGKLATLSCGYQGSVGALIAMKALEAGIPEDELQGIVDRWRAANSKIVGFWYALQYAIVECISTGRSQRVGYIGIKKVADLQNKLCFLQLELPSGRCLFYSNPHIGVNKWGGDSIGFYGMDQTSKKWTKQESYGGKICENICQAVARDCLAIAIERLWLAGYKIVGHVHDEVLIEGNEGDLTDVSRIMGAAITWAPGLILRAEGFEGEYYKKDG